MAQAYHLPVQQVMRGGHARYTRASPFDFLGLLDLAAARRLNLVGSLLNDDQRAVPLAIEVKRTGKKAASLALQGKTTGSGSGVARHQMEALVAWWRRGGLAMLMWDNGGIWYRLVGWEIACWYEIYVAACSGRKGRKSIPLDEWYEIGPTPMLLQGLIVEDAFWQPGTPRAWTNAIDQKRVKYVGVPA